jgi:hypothetical protein
MVVILENNLQFQGCFTNMAAVFLPKYQMQKLFAFYYKPSSVKCVIVNFWMPDSSYLNSQTCETDLFYSSQIYVKNNVMSSEPNSLSFSRFDP